MLDDAFKVSIQPDLAYGVIDKNLIFRINRSSFADSKNIKTGMQVRGQLTKEGPSMIFWVKEVNNEDIVLDGNHPLAGQTQSIFGLKQLKVFLSIS
jgi:FKBP-type peptidyl-prolyl cis-trans isomerase SlyD